VQETERLSDGRQRVVLDVEDGWDLYERLSDMLCHDAAACRTCSNIAAVDVVIDSVPQAIPLWRLIVWFEKLSGEAYVDGLSDGTPAVTTPSLLLPLR
jgi:tRNA A58 N-methylase Trm61